VIDEISGIRSAKVHSHGDVGISVGRIPIPEGNLDHIDQLPLYCLDRLAAVELEIVLRHHHEVNLMQVKLVILERAILDRPLFHGSLRGRDRRRIIR